MQTLIQMIEGRLWFLSTEVHAIDLVFLLILVSVAAIIDMREHRVPNWLVGIGIGIGVLFHASAVQGQGTIFALSGLCVGMGVLFPLYALRVMGAGDVKLMGMIGAFVGMSGVLGVVLASMAVGGVLALSMAACKRALPQLLVNVHLLLIHRPTRPKRGSDADFMPATPSVGKMPYAVAIWAGTVIQLYVVRY